MRKKIGTIWVAVLILSGVAVPTSSAAVIKGGVACTKSSATLKVGAKTYTCAKNPLLMPTKLTWTLSGCLTAYSLWQDAKQQFAGFADIAKLAGPDGQKTLDDLQASIDGLQKTMRTQACVKGA